MPEFDDNIKNIKSRYLLLRAHVWALATVVPLMVRLVALPRLLRWLTPPAELCPYRRFPVDRIVTVVRRRLANPRNMRRRACLREGLVLFHFLRLSERPAELHFGIYPTPDKIGRMHAHCWVTLGGDSVSTPPGDPHAVLLVHGGDGEV